LIRKEFQNILFKHTKTIKDFMKKISEAEKAALKTRPLSRQGYIRSSIMQMQPKEIILIEPRDWTWKTAVPSRLCRRVERETGRTYECEKVLEPSGGWIITRKN
jgi:hypothetical protein